MNASLFIITIWFGKKIQELIRVNESQPETDKKIPLHNFFTAKVEIKHVASNLQTIKFKYTSAKTFLI